jgi:hypothetical protein
MAGLLQWPRAAAVPTELAGKAFGLFRDPHLLQQREGHLRCFLLCLFADEDLRKVDVVHDGHMGKKVKELEDHSNLFPDLEPVFLVIIEGDPVNHNRAAIDLLQTVQTPKEGRFA